MILVDSSVWIDAHRKKSNPEVEFLKTLLRDSSAQVCLSHIIYFEVLRGISSELERKRAQKVLDLCQCFDYTNDDFSSTISLYLKCQKMGLNSPKLGDWLILKTVLDHSLELLTSDRGFSRINKIYPFKLIVL